MGKEQQELFLFTRVSTYICHHLRRGFLPLSVLEHAVGTISYKGSLQYSVKIMMLTKHEHAVHFFSYWSAFKSDSATIRSQQHATGL